MPSLVIKKLPEEIHAKLRETALSHHRSMSGEAIAILEQTLLGEVPAVPAFEAVRGPRPLTQELLDRSRNENRP